MSFLHTVLAFAVTLGVLVTFHELGHYVVARWCGVKVLRFSVGMGRVIWSKRFGRDQTEWALSVLPLGGYVKMLDVRDHEIDLHSLKIHTQTARLDSYKHLQVSLLVRLYLYS